MEHVVFSAAVDGVGEEFRRVSSLEEAVRVVEHLRNDLGIEDAAVFSLTAAPLAFRTYYRVEVPGVPAGGVDSVSEMEPAEPALSVTTLEEPELEPVPSLVPLASSSSSMEALASMAEIVGATESAELANPAAADLHQISELPAMLAPGLEPREGESEHSLGYFTR